MSETVSENENRTEKEVDHVARAREGCRKGATQFREAAMPSVSRVEKQ